MSKKLKGGVHHTWIAPSHADKIKVVNKLHSLGWMAYGYGPTIRTPAPASVVYSVGSDLGIPVHKGNHD